jgi:hypothetical protein
MYPMFPSQGPTCEVSGAVRLFATHDHDNAVPGSSRAPGSVLITGTLRNSVAA